MSQESALSKLQKFKEIRKRQVYCPVAKHRVMVTPLTVADDIALRTMVSSPDIYEQELLKLIYEHSLFPDISGGTKPNFDKFAENFSNFDKKILIWGIYDSTYGKLGTHQLVCPKCKTEFKDTVLIKSLVSEDTIKELWTHDVPFTQYNHNLTIDVGLEDFKKIEFQLTIPSMKKHLDIMSLLNMDEIKDNVNKYNSVLSKQDELALITTAIRLYETDENFDEIIGFSDIHEVICNFIPLDVSQDVLDGFDDVFGIFDPKFKKEITCANNACKHKFDLDVDIEVAMFRSFFRFGNQ